MTLTVGSLFSGIGGLELGLERAGMRTLWQVESDPYARKVLAKHWPTVARHEDVRSVGAAQLAPVDLICGGFPCQDISNAGKREGIDGERSGLWGQFSRIVRELRPRYVLVENVAALIARGLGRVLGDLAASGYDAEWDCIPAAAVGAPHRRDRLFLVAYANRLAGPWQSEPRFRGEVSSVAGPDGEAGPLANAGLSRFEKPPRSSARSELPRRRAAGGGRDAVANPLRNGRLQGADAVLPRQSDPRGPGEEVPDAASSRGRRLPIFAGRESLDAHRDGCTWWRTEPDVGRVAHGVPKRVDRLRCLGNAVVPEVAEYVGRRILAFEASHA